MSLRLGQDGQKITTGSWLLSVAHNMVPLRELVRLRAEFREHTESPEPPGLGNKIASSSQTSQPIRDSQVRCLKTGDKDQVKGVAIRIRLRNEDQSS